MTEAAGFDDATEEGSISVVPVIGVTIEGPATCKYGGVGCRINSLKVAPRLLETMVSDASSEEVCVGVKPVCRGENYQAGTGEANL